MGQVWLKFDKLYRYDRLQEPCSVAIPFRQGELRTPDCVRIRDGERILPSQARATSQYQDGSVRYLFVRFLADLPGNAGKELVCTFDDGEQMPPEKAKDGSVSGLSVEKTGDGWSVENGAVSFALRDGSENLFQRLRAGGRTYEAEQFVGPLLSTERGDFRAEIEKWRLLEQGEVCARFQGEGRCTGDDGTEFGLVMGLTVYAGKPWIDVSCRLVNTTGDRQHIASLVFAVKRNADAAYAPKVISGGGGQAVLEDFAKKDGKIYHVLGVKDLERVQESIDPAGVRTCAARSNYKTYFDIGEKGSRTGVVADAELLLKEANEQYGEVLYGTFFGDVTDETGGVCATVFQAQQNFPKAVTADESGLYVMLVPEGVGRVEMASGMARQQRFLLHFHGAEESLRELDNRSLIYQMPDVPRLSPEVFEKAGVMPDFFVDGEKTDMDFEILLVNKADGHARCYGMMNWGDTPDMGYTDQGRGKGHLVWTNNEYDYPHAMYQMYARSGVRRFLDYARVAAEHWMDVDVCHDKGDPIHYGGQWEHTAGHCIDGVMACSHQWVEGLLDYYHFTGEERALETALGIGENILRLLEGPMFQKGGESSARETGWALRTLTALYVETWDQRWTEKCRWIVGHFQEWMEEYGGWLAPYTDNTVIRVGFMISVAVGSLMRYYRVFGGEDVKKLILSAVDDLVESCRLDNGLFYYKELPSLSRNGTNALLLEAMAAGWELTGDRRYLECGKKTFEYIVKLGAASGGGAKRIIEDTVIAGAGGTKGFAQSFLPLALFYKALIRENML